MVSNLDFAKRVDAQSIEQESKLSHKNLLANGNEILAWSAVTFLGATARQLRVRLSGSAAIDLKAPPVKEDRFHDCLPNSYSATLDPPSWSVYRAKDSVWISRKFRQLPCAGGVVPGTWLPLNPSAASSLQGAPLTGAEICLPGGYDQAGVSAIAGTARGQASPGTRFVAPKMGAC
jgi:hypothetical protein